MTERAVKWRQMRERHGPVKIKSLFADRDGNLGSTSSPSPSPHALDEEAARLSDEDAELLGRQTVIEMIAGLSLRNHEANMLAGVQVHGKDGPRTQQGAKTLVDMAGHGQVNKLHATHDS